MTGAVPASVEVKGYFAIKIKGAGFDPKPLKCFSDNLF